MLWKEQEITVTGLKTEKHQYCGMHLHAIAWPSY